MNKESRSAEFNRWRHVSPKPGQAKFRAVGADSIALLTERIRGMVKQGLHPLLPGAGELLANKMSYRRQLMKPLLQLTMTVCIYGNP